MILTVLALIIIILTLIVVAIPLAILETVVWALLAFVIFLVICAGALVVDIIVVVSKGIHRLFGGK